MTHAFPVRPISSTSPLLDDRVRKALEPSSEGKMVLVAVGNPLRRDDGVGMYIGERAARFTSPSFSVVLAGFTPERVLDDILRERPAKVVFVDAASFGGTPGEVRVLSEEEIVATTLSTHMFPLPVLARLIAEEVGCLVLFVGIEPQDVSFGEGLSRAVEEAAQAVLSYLEEVFQRA
ncbi:MAG: hydrogenase 3 maturation endopeptidase HyCI [Candidatus Caldatribacterium sp.]|nr:hydrogenase 3 maturation endopeptidase HyCI [Candidatus Caldatribacterium sp.]